MAGKARLLGDLIGESGLKFLNNAENASDLVRHAKISESAANKFINLRNGLSGQRLTADTDISGMNIRQSTFDKINGAFGEGAARTTGNASLSNAEKEYIKSLEEEMKASERGGFDIQTDKALNAWKDALDEELRTTSRTSYDELAEKSLSDFAGKIEDTRIARGKPENDPNSRLSTITRVKENIEASRAARERSNNGGFSRQFSAETWLDKGAKTDSDLARQLTDPIRKKMGLSDSDADWLKARKEALDVVRTFEESGQSLRNPENLRRTQEAWGKAPSQPVGKGTDAASSSVNAAEAEKTGGVTTESTRNAATQVPTAEGGGTTGELSFDNYSRGALEAIVREQGKKYWGRGAQEKYHFDKMDRRYADINRMKNGKEKTAAIEQFNQDLQSGPSINDYMSGNQVWGKAAGVGVAALTASAVMGDGRRSNAQLYSSPF